MSSFKKITSLFTPITGDAPVFIYSTPSKIFNTISLFINRLKIGGAAKSSVGTINFITPDFNPGKSATTDSASSVGTKHLK